MLSPLWADFPIISEGTTHITYHSPEKNKSHQITCQEKVELDFNFNYLQCLSPGHDLEKQIHFHDELHDLYSDQLVATYVHRDGALELDLLRIYGNVCLIQKEEPDQILAFDEAQFALADQLDFDYQDQKMNLKAKQGSKVLFYDQINNYRISAPEVLLTRNPITQKPKVNGIGRVKFLFDESEIERFKTHLLGHKKDFNDE